MSSSNLIRWSGLAASVGGVLFVVLVVAFVVLLGDQPDSVAATTSTYVILEVLFLVAAVLIFLGLVGLYARQAEQAGTLGLIAFLAAFIGTALFFGFEWASTFVVPALAETAPDFLDAEPSGVLAAGFILTFVLFALGWLLFGLASLRARVLPRGSAVLLMIGAVLFLLAGFFLELFGVVFGVALAWMGYALWSGAGQPVLTAEATA